MSALLARSCPCYSFQTSCIRGNREAKRFRGTCRFVCSWRSTMATSKNHCPNAFRSVLRPRDKVKQFIILRPPPSQKKTLTFFVCPHSSVSLPLDVAPFWRLSVAKTIRFIVRLHFLLVIRGLAPRVLLRTLPIVGTSRKGAEGGGKRSKLSSF